ncbi:hypothetical protein [Halobacteriovorax sp. JY17]|uniref:hypothetical protein n=1 Tax=Halobacteriovorax sp. JY17 TaxID=2014617 RepID=UPI000C558987|nr:hypothetical protein [Halobacteriovorax sp. JY17]PIK16043.1 MAG: hypothetical protein CES88_04750 [Halobacteriovorax sp. JY17]
MKNISIMTLFFLCGISLDAKQTQSIHVKTTYKRSKTIWGVYTLNKQEWFQGKKKHSTGPKSDHVFMRKKGRLVFISPKFKSGVVSYDVSEVPYKLKKKNNYSVESSNLEKVEYEDIPFRNEKELRTTAFSCKSKWKTIECTQTLTEDDRVDSMISNISTN